MAPKRLLGSQLSSCHGLNTVQRL